MLGAAAASMIFGPLSDIIGPKKPIFINLILLMLSSIICAMANNIYVVLFGRLLQGIATGGASVAARAMLRFAFTDDNLKKAASIMSIVSPFIFVTAPTAGSFLHQYLGNWRYLFIIMALYATGIGLYSYQFFPSLNKSKTHESSTYLTTTKQNFQKVIQSKTFVLTYLYSAQCHL